MPPKPTAPYSPQYFGGVHVAAGNVDGAGFADMDNNGRPDILTSPGPGSSPNIRAYQGTQPVLLTSGAFNFNAYASGFAGGVHVAGGRNTLSFIQTTPSGTVGIFAGETLSFVIGNPSQPESFLSVTLHDESIGDSMNTDELLAKADDDTLVDRMNDPAREENSMSESGIVDASIDQLFADKLLLMDLLS